MTRTYISAKLEDDLRLRSLRDEVYNCVNGSKYYKKVDPHITVIPPFNVKSGCEEEVENIVNDSKVTGNKVEINNLAVWENISKPYVVMLDVSVDLSDERDRLLEELKPIAAGKVTNPVRPHITLFKTGEWYENHPEKTRRSIQREIIDRTSFQDTKIHKVVPEFKHT